jgi:DNA-directed RNA polymerase subunit beta'
MTVPDVKKRLIRETEKKVVEIEQQCRRGFITDDERYRLVVKEWEDTTKAVTDALQNSLDEFNPIYMMANSGARGSMNQIRQLAGMRGLMANTAGKTIEIPIKANFREGLTVREYFTSSRGARKGLADTALRTADSGYLTRRLVDVSQDVIIREHDCGTHDGIEVAAEEENGAVIRTFGDAINGRFPVEDIVDLKTGELLFSCDTMLATNDEETLALHGITSVRIRTVLDCEATSGVCAKCYGQNLATGEAVSIGEAVGVIAAQSIGEPGTQLTMRTFHTGGVAGDDITQGLPRVEELFEARKPKKMSILSETTGVVSLEETRKNAIVAISVSNEEDGDTRMYQTPYSSGIRVKSGDTVKKGDRLTDGALNPHDVLRIKSKDAAQTYLISEVQKVYRQQGVDINDKHIEVIVRQMMRKVRIEDGGDSDLLAGTTIDILEFRRVNKAIAERSAAGETCVDEVTGEPRGLLPVTYTQTLMGITKASLATDSFLSAASFQETTKVLTEAAIKGKVDHLMGLKENVIIGKLVPAGSGLALYRGVNSEYSDITVAGDEEFEVDLTALEAVSNIL